MFSDRLSSIVVLLCTTPNISMSLKLVEGISMETLGRQGYIAVSNIG